MIYVGFCMCSVVIGWCGGIGVIDVWEYVEFWCGSWLVSFDGDFVFEFDGLFDFDVVVYVWCVGVRLWWIGVLVCGFVVWNFDVVCESIIFWDLLLNFCD